MEISILSSDQKENLRTVLDFVERWNKHDVDTVVAQSANELSELLKDFNEEN